MSLPYHFVLIPLHAVLILVFLFRRIPAIALLFLWTLFCVEIAMFSGYYARCSELVLIDEHALRRPLSKAYAGISIWEERKLISASSKAAKFDLIKLRLVLHRQDGSERCLTIVCPGHEYHYTTANGAELSSSSPLDSAGLGKFLQDNGIDLDRPGVKDEMALVLQAMLDIETRGFTGVDNFVEYDKHFGEVEYRPSNGREEWLWRRVLTVIVLVIVLWCLGILGGYRYRKKTAASPVGTSERTGSDTHDTISNST